MSDAFALLCDKLPRERGPESMDPGRSEEYTDTYHMSMGLMEDVHMVEYDIYEKPSYLGEAEKYSYQFMLNEEL